MRVRAILNPRAGLAAARARGAVERGASAWPHVEIKVTEGPGHARDLAREAAERGDALVLAVGGDGTANEAAWGVLGSRTALGLVPVGSGNGLARTLGMSLDPRRALAQLADGEYAAMDVGRINGRPFLNMAGAGLDAAIGAAFHAWGRNGGRRGVLPYFFLGCQEITRFKPRRFVIQADGTHWESAAWLVTFANGRQYGGGATITPRARLNDGLLELVLIRSAARLRLLLALPYLFAGRLDHLDFYRSLTAREITCRGDGPVAHHRDGEPEPEGTELEVGVEPRALRILVPRATAHDPCGPFCGKGVAGPAGELP